MINDLLSETGCLLFVSLIPIKEKICHLHYIVYKNNKTAVVFYL